MKVKINDEYYDVISVQSIATDKEWDNRSKMIISFPNEDHLPIFEEISSWSTVVGENKDEYVEFDKSEYNVLGDVLFSHDGCVYLTLGKLSDLEQAYQLLYGGDEE